MMQKQPYKISIVYDGTFDILYLASESYYFLIKSIIIEA